MNEHLVIVGGLNTRAEQHEALDFIESLGCPAICDVTSGLRFLHHPLLDHSRDFTNLQVECVWQLGGRLVSKKLGQWLESRNGQRHVRIDPYGLREDPYGSVTEWRSSLPRITSPASLREAPSPQVERANTTRALSISNIISKTDWNEWALFAGTSLPIRELDSEALAGDTCPIVGANRGASGIDGITSTICGFAMGLNMPVIAYIGDMTFLHDISGLSFISQLKTRLILVVANNHGNGIFKTLPIARNPDVFERYFLTPHSHDLSHACRLYNVAHTHIKLNEFSQTFEAAKNSGTPQVIEIVAQ
jgi:2-succinyl-5-enolpyruvyl-6-hydroxy-3-cyclohexene-1-carboxylate synthase